MSNQLSLLTILAAATIIAAPADDPVVGAMEVFTVTLDADGNEQLAAAEQIQPGQTLEYLITYGNVSQTKVNNLNILGQIPQYTRYIADSATKLAAVKFAVSIDGGKSFAAEPVKFMAPQPDGSTVEVIAPPEMYTQLRWTVPELLPETSVKVRYRVKVQ